ncbi:response regulator [Chitinimonas sp. BJB300]|uniref:response regulator n=1 Tax=Chitinimonas sp. BJB300 TaxID=1559339 RepID=UPI000C119689|nr:response regulator [Chitinimonas sp. BJB300]PHV10990.1 hypothetical protein CSQ89_13270 [Chitinimonas sp. BJB300]TSJ87546.1 response regulator [Chitinimonas sp. BJB300]
MSEEKPVILSVDDDDFTHELVKEALGEYFDIQFAVNGRHALERLTSVHPDLILLDAEMPVMDGYETCRRMKRHDGLVDVPVLFLSARVTNEDRYKGFDAGGDDYLTKPFDLAFLLTRVQALLTLARERKQLKEGVSFATSAAMTSLTSLGEMGAVVEGIRSFNTCTTHEQLADALLASIVSFDLNGVAQIRSFSQLYTRTSKGPASPLDVSVANHMAGMDRLVQLKSRLAINYAPVILLINNLPLSDSDFCGRLRDHLAVLTESAASKARAIDANLKSEQRGALLTSLMQEVSTTLVGIDAAQRGTQTAITIAANEIVHSVEQALLKITLTEAQEDYLVSIVRNGLGRLSQMQTGGTEIQDKLTHIVQMLKRESTEA